MSESGTPPLRYRLVWSELVRQAIRDWILAETAAGRRDEALAVMSELIRRLEVYPQFGEPFLDLLDPGATIWSGAVGPITIRYTINEPRRLVFIVNPPRFMS